MKNILFLLFLFFIARPIKAQNNELRTVAQSISIEDLKDRLYFLASDSLEGRKTYEKGQKYAAEYISNSFNTNNLKQLNGAEGYYQKFVRYRLTRGSNWFYNKDLNIYLNDFFCNYNVKDSSELELVFAGNATEMDLKGRNLDKKGIVFFANTMESGLDKVNQLSIKYPNSIMFLCLKNKTHLHLTTIFKEKPMKISEIQNYSDYRRYNRILYDTPISKDKLDSAQFISDYLNENSKTQLLIISEKQIEKLFGVKAKKLRKTTKKNKKINVNLLREIPNSKIYQKLDYMESIDTLQTENVLGYIEGTDKKQEAIIVSAHYDHVGKTYKGEICRGADDNASGTAALMEIAEAFSLAHQQGLKPKRSIIFIAFTGEEEGLVGSWHYVNNPLFPLENTICNINMDMIGRNKNDEEKNANKVFIAGRDKDNHKRKKIFKRINKQNDLLKLDTHPPFFNNLTWIFGSDQHAFHMKNIPSNIVYTGDHKDYHTPADTPDKINYEKLCKISKLVFLTVWELANQ